MANDTFRDRYQILETIAEGPVRTCHAMAATGAIVMAHFLDASAAQGGLLELIDGLRPAERRRVIEVTEVDGETVVVTRFILDFRSLEEWLRAHQAVEPTLPSPVDVRAGPETEAEPPAAPAPPLPDMNLATMSPPTDAEPPAATEPEAPAPPPQPFPDPILEAAPRPTDEVSEAATEMEPPEKPAEEAPGEFTRLFRKPEPAAPMPPAPATPPAALPTPQPILRSPLPPPPVPPVGAATSKDEPAEPPTPSDEQPARPFTDMFKAPGAPGEPAEEASVPGAGAPRTPAGLPPPPPLPFPLEVGERVDETPAAEEPAVRATSPGAKTTPRHSAPQPSGPPPESAAPSEAPGAGRQPEPGGFTDQFARPSAPGGWSSDPGRGPGMPADPRSDPPGLSPLPGPADDYEKRLYDMSPRPVPSGGELAPERPPEPVPPPPPYVPGDRATRQQSLPVPPPVTRDEYGLIVGPDRPISATPQPFAAPSAPAPAPAAGNAAGKPAGTSWLVVLLVVIVVLAIALVVFFATRGA